MTKNSMAISTNSVSLMAAEIASTDERRDVIFSIAVIIVVRVLCTAN